MAAIPISTKGQGVVVCENPRDSSQYQEKDAIFNFTLSLYSDPITFGDPTDKLRCTAIQYKRV